MLKKLVQEMCTSFWHKILARVCASS